MRSKYVDDYISKLESATSRDDVYSMYRSLDLDKLNGSDEFYEVQYAKDKMLDYYRDSSRKHPDDMSDYELAKYCRGED